MASELAEALAKSQAASARALIEAAKRANRSPLEPYPGTVGRATLGN